jgi:hypothetical protein
MEEVTLKIKLLSFGWLLSAIGLVYLYIQEFNVFSNTIGVKNLLLGSLLTAAALAALLLLAFRKQLHPWQDHWTPIVILVFPMLFFAPLFGSWINRSGGSKQAETFIFVSEGAYLREPYGVLKNQKIRPAGYMLIAKQNDKTYQFKYKSQPFYPLSKAGDEIVVPVKVGLFGVKVVNLE